MTAFYISIAFCLALSLMLLLSPLLLKHELTSQLKIRFVCCFSVVFCVLALLIYGYLGSPRIIPLIAERNARMEQLKLSINANSATVKTNPKNLGAWIELGQDFLETGQFSAAANAFKQSVLLSGGNPKLLLAYAKSLIRANNEKVSEDAKKALEMVLLQDKQNPDARYFMAIYKLENGKMQEAMSEMKSLYKSLPDDSPLKAAINRQIGRN